MSGAGHAARMKREADHSPKLVVKNGVFWDVTPCGSCNKRRFGGNLRLLHKGDKNR
jgi:hypothetical protein